MEDDGNKESPEVTDGEEGEKILKSGEGNVGPSSRIKEDSSAYWESLLDQRSLHVLLVENDPSVRRVITLLLRKCGYQAAPNGLQAWRILQDLNNRFDLVLSEVDIPCLSGIDLLCNIMSHHVRRHTPVVMMSFRDSISLVFRCLSEGAVDYLLKPVRKNELQKLWLHIWRRWQRSSGIESENGAKAQNSMKLNGIENVDDDNTGSNNGSNNEDATASFGLIAEEVSDNASDTQSSWRKTVNSSQPVSPLDQMAKHPDSTCTFMCSKSEVFGQEEVPTTIRRECKADEEQLDSREFQAPNRLLKISESKEAVNATEEETPLHLSVKRLREVKDIITTAQDDHNALSHLGLSALSRYKAASNSNKVPSTNKGSISPHDYTSDLNEEP